MDTPASFGDWLKRTREELAKPAGCSMFALGNLEAGSFLVYLRIPKQQQSHFIGVFGEVIRRNRLRSLITQSSANPDSDPLMSAGFPASIFLNSEISPWNKASPKKY